MWTVSLPRFLLTCIYEVRKSGVKEQTTEMTFNGGRCSDIARTLKIDINTVIRILKNSRQSD
ncbi:IS1-like element transposase [Escherichia coli]|uniref:IS1-like element transposase n=1 Tax=Escherichia coli TaxID=562 RepID=UPI00084F88F9|nr:transposase [Escherichia coli]